MKKIITSLLIGIISLPVFSQTNYSIVGKIIDESTKLPLQAASVFAENTTIGTATGNDGVFQLRLPNGGYTLVITYSGYQTETKRITTADAGSELIIEVKKKVESMEEFVVKSSAEVEDGLEKYGDFFIENFIGKTTNSTQCVIKNKDVLKFYYYRRTKRLKILATQPLEIVNEALGYTIKYELDSFVHEYNTQISLYSGYPLFQEMETSSIDQLLKWNAARKIAYNGSILHFMRSMYQKNLKDEGFEIQFIVKKNNKETAIPIKDFYNAVNYNRDDSSNTVEILPRQNEVAVIYKNEEPTSMYMNANPDVSQKFQLSVVSFLPNESLIIEQNGFYFEQNDITINGYWAWEKVGDMLPYDFKERSTLVKDIPKPIVVQPKPGPEKTDPVKTQEKPVYKEPDPEVTAPAKPLVAQAAANEGSFTGVNWQMQESRVIDGNNMFYYQRGGPDNTINFDNDLYLFNADNTGTYFYNGQQYNFNWKFLNMEKTKMEMAILYPVPLIVNFENVSVTATSFKYTRMQKVNGVNYVAIETRTIK